ncbi:MAG: leucine-rich repeat domain-containing protein [Prevotella sp.]|nr:leucine-rich repeat domain-containing protein [Prevotella sp.]
MKLKTLLTLAVASFCSWQGAWADDVVANVTLQEKNSLSSEILALSGIDDLKTVTHLTVTTNPGVQLGDEDWTTLKSMSALVELDLSNASANTVPDGQFRYCCANLVTVSLPKDLISIGKSAFYQKANLVTIVVPNTVTAIGEETFYQCSNLEYCDLSACQITIIPSHCFSNCGKLNSFTIPSTVTRIESFAFSSCTNFSSPLPAGLEYIGSSAFSYAGMNDIDVVIPEGATLGGSVFYHSGIRSIELPTTYYEYGYDFSGCSNLQTVTLKSPTILSYNGTFDASKVSNITLKVPSHLITAYKSHKEWSKFMDAIAISPSVTEYTVSQDLNLSNSSMRMEGAPNVFFTENASLTIAGNAAQTFNDFIASAKTYNYNSSGNQYTMIINEAADVTVNGDYKQRLYTSSSKKWYFLCLPFDFTVGDVTAESGQFVIRTYDGVRRNTQNSDNGNWSANLTSDVEIKAGTGFILQTSESTWVTFKAKVSGTNHVFKKESDEINTPLAANNTNASASNANTGWNMVGNPWQAFYNIHKMNYTAPFTVYRASYNRYETYSPSDDDYALSPFQALFVQCPNGISSIDFPATGRQLTSEVTSQNAARMNTPGGRQLFDIEVSDGLLSDKTRLVVNVDATMDYEIGRDASKFFDNGSPTPQIFSLDNDGTQYAINERPADSGTLQLGILFAEDGEYTLSALRNDIGQVILTDHETGIKTDLQLHGYTFSAEAGTCESRFTLSFGNAVTGISTANNNEAAITEVYTLDGAKVCNTTNGLQKGVYVVRHGQQTQKVIIK